MVVSWPLDVPRRAWRRLRCRLVVTFARLVDLVGALPCPLAAGIRRPPGTKKSPASELKVTTLAGPDGGWSRGWGVEPEKRESSAAVHPMVASSGRYRHPPPPWDFSQ